MTDPTEFYGIASAMVKAWPATYPNAEAHEYVAKRPNTFAVLRSLNELEADNLAKTIETARPPYLFIRGYDANAYRSGVKIEYPLIGCAEDTMRFFNPITKGAKKQRHKIWGRIKYPIPYNTGKVILYLVISVSLSMISFYYFRTNYIVGNLFLALFIGFVAFKEQAIIKRILKR